MCAEATACAKRTNPRVAQTQANKCRRIDSRVFLYLVDQFYHIRPVWFLIQTIISSTSLQTLYKRTKSFTYHLLLTASSLDGRAMFTRFFSTRKHFEPYISACLLSGSVEVEIIRDGWCSSRDFFAFVEPQYQGSSFDVKQLFTRYPLLSVGDMLQWFKENYLDSNPDLYLNNWKLFVRTMNYDENDYRLDTYTLIDHNMPFLNIPEYLMNNNCLTICTNTHTRTQSTMGKVSSNTL